MSEDSSSDMMELEDGALLEPQIEANLRRLREEERLLLERQAVMEAGACDDIAALEHQDAIRLNQLQQLELQKQAAHVQRVALRQQAQAHSQDNARALEPRRETITRRRAACTVRVNNLHSAEAIETDV